MIRFTDADKGALLELVKGKTPTKTKAAGNAAKARTYFSKTQNPVDALYLAIRHKVDEKGTKQALKFDPDDPKAKSFKRTLLKMVLTKIFPQTQNKLLMT